MRLSAQPRHFDGPTSAALNSGPGTDTRQWCSFGTVDQETADARSVTFTDAYGPLVNVTLHPSGIPVVCRVAHEVAGNGEGEWFPFVSGDEVEVLVNEGSETAGCVIVGRLNQEIDKWPKTVAGMDATKNNFAFRRMRTPYVIETASGYMIRHALTGAFLGLTPEGALTFSNADKAFLSLRPDFLGLQSGDGNVLLQIDVGAQQIDLEVAGQPTGGTKFIIDAKASSFYTTGTLELGTSGSQAFEHATSLEALARLFYVFLAAAGAAATTPLSLVGFFASFIPPGTATAFGLLLQAAAKLNDVAAPDLPELQQTLLGIIQTPRDPVAAPGLGAPGLLI